MYHLDPHAMVKFQGVSVPTIIDHKTSHLLGLGNNHGDVQHWFPKVIGKDLRDIRNDVAALMDGIELPEPEPEEERLAKGDKGEDVKAMQKKLLLLGYDLGRWGADGDFGSATEAAVMGFQVNHGQSMTGIADEATLTAINEAVDALPPEATYTVVLRGLSLPVVNGLKACYPECEVTKE